MYLIQVKSRSKKDVELFLISLCIVLLLIRTSIPFLKYPFLALFMLIGVHLLLNKRSELFATFRTVKNFPVTLFLLFFYIVIACLISDKIYLSVIKDIINIVVILSVMIMLMVFVKTRNDLKLLFIFFLYLIVLFALIIAIQRIHNYIYDSTYSYEIFTRKNEIVDSNFALLPVFFGMVGCLYFLDKESSVYKKIIYNLILFICSINIFLSGSKRGLLIFLLFFLAIMIIQVFGLLGKNKQIKKIAINTSSYFVLLLTAIILIAFIFFTTSIYFKNSVLEVLGVNNKAYLKIQISQTLSRYFTLINMDSNEDELYAKIWKPVFDPMDPDAGYGNGNYKIAKSLSGKNVEIVPKGSKGYLIDNTCIGDSSQTHAYYFNLLRSTNVKAGDSILASIYCYVSEDFDGNVAAFRAVGAKEGDPDAFYDLKNKGCWQKLVMRVNCKNGELRIYFYMNKGWVRNFSTLRGYAIFAYPEYVNAKEKKVIYKPITKSRETFGKSSFESGYRQGISFLYINPKKLWVNGKANLFSFSGINLSALYELHPAQDPIRAWIAKIVSEDTVYHGYNTIIEVPRNIDRFGEDRASRWKFAVEIYIKEYNWSQKIFGGGFNFLSWFSYYFNDDKTKIDYPHNPFLHILLYSGILGLLIYIFFLYRVFWYYIKYIKEYPLLFVFFIITFYFTLFSGGSPFEPPIMGFFMVLPFVINSIYIQEKLKHQTNESKNDVIN